MIFFGSAQIVTTATNTICYFIVLFVSFVTHVNLINKNVFAVGITNVTHVLSTTIYNEGMSRMTLKTEKLSSKEKLVKKKSHFSVPIHGALPHSNNSSRCNYKCNAYSHICVVGTSTAKTICFVGV